MTNFKNIIINNRTNTTALKADQFETKQDYTNWKNDVESLRLAVSNYAVANLENLDNDVITDCTNDIFESYRKVLSYFTNKAIGEKLKPQATDLNSLLTFIGMYKKAKDSQNGKDFLPVGSITFRKCVEDFISDRLTARQHMTAEDIEKEKQAKREAKKAERKAKKEAEKVQKKAEKKSAKAEKVENAA